MKSDSNKTLINIYEPDENLKHKIERMLVECGYKVTDNEDSIPIIGPNVALEYLQKFVEISSAIVIIKGDDLKSFYEKFGILDVKVITVDSLNSEELCAAVDFANRWNAEHYPQSRESDVPVIEKEEEQLQLMDQKIFELSKLIKNMRIGIIILNKNNKITAINEYAKNILHPVITSKETEKTDIEEFLKVLKHENTVIDGVNSTSRNRILKKLPNDRVIEVGFALFGEFGHTISYIHDISELGWQVEWLQSLFSAVAIGVMVLNPDKRIIWANDTIRGWFSDRLDYLNGYCFEVWKGSDTVCENCKMEKAFKFGEICKFMEKIVSSDETEHFYEIIATPILSIKGEVVQILQLVMDVTERVMLIKELKEIHSELEKANKQYRSQNRTFRMITEISTVLQLETELETVLHIILTAVTTREGLGFNRAFLLIVDKSKNALVGGYAIGPSTPEEAGKIWAELRSEDRTLSGTLRAYQQAVQTEDTEVMKIVKEFEIPLDSDHILVKYLWEGEAVIINPEDTKKWEQTHEIWEKTNSPFFAIVPLLAMTKPVGIIIVDNMITKKPITFEDLEILRSIANHASLAIERSILTKELSYSYTKLEDAYAELRFNQQKLIKSEKLSAIGEMAAQIAHEIKNPLVALGGFARNILRDHSVNDKMREKLVICVEEAERLENIIEDIMGFTKFSAPDKQIEDINTLLENVFVLFEPELDKNKIKVKKEFDTSIPPFPFDPLQLRQVLVNLIRNSMSVLTEGGIIDVRTYRDENYCWIEFADNGPGIPGELGNKVFKPFFTTRHSGTGLGLSISSQIIEAHGGEIWFRNNKAGGVTFFIRLPMETNSRIMEH